jgi:hypothetical protein
MGFIRPYFLQQSEQFLDAMCLHVNFSIPLNTSLQWISEIYSILSTTEAMSFSSEETFLAHCHYRVYPHFSLSKRVAWSVCELLCPALIYTMPSVYVNGCRASRKCVITDYSVKFKRRGLQMLLSFLVSWKTTISLNNEEGSWVVFLVTKCWYTGVQQYPGGYMLLYCHVLEWL